MDDDQDHATLKRLCHEFHVPVVAIRGALEFIQDELGEKRIDLSEDYIGDIDSWVSLMQRMLSNTELFLNEDSFGVPQHFRRTYLLRDVVMPAVKSTSHLLRERGHRPNSVQVIGFREIPPLWIDRNQMTQVVFNILANAIKYSLPGEMDLTIKAESIGVVHTITFTDYGIGIEEVDEPHVFEAGYRGSSSHLVSGSGLGLYVADRIIDGHGGKMRIASPRKPTAIEILLPASLRLNKPPNDKKQVDTLD